MSENYESPSVTYKQGMTVVWSDGEKVTIKNKAGKKWVEDNVDQIFGVGEFEKIRVVAYLEILHEKKRKDTHARTYECISGYIPQRVIDDLAEELPEEDKKKAALDALKEL